MVGDSKADVGSARAAGMPVVLVRGGYTQTPVEELGADLVCDSLLDLPAALQAFRKQPEASERKVATGSDAFPNLIYCICSKP